MNLATFAQGERLSTRLATVLDLGEAAGRAAAPVVDLLVRLALAKAFFSPGMFPGIGAAGFHTAWPMIFVQLSRSARRESPSLLEGDRRFESGFLQRRVRLSGAQRGRARKVPRFRGGLRHGGDVRLDGLTASRASRAYFL